MCVMCTNPDWVQYMHQLNQYLVYQSQQLEKMNKMIQELNKEVKALNERSTTQPVIRNEYKFDLLKVESLSGTLNIGIKPDGTASSVDEFSVEQSMDVPVVEEEYSQLYRDIQKEISEYFHEDVYNRLQNVEKKYDYPLDSKFRKSIVEDVQKQVDSRIQYYLKQTKINEGDSEQESQIGQNIANDVKRDIEQTFEAYIKNLPKRG